MFSSSGTIFINLSIKHLLTAHFIAPRLEYSPHLKTGIRVAGKQFFSPFVEPMVVSVCLQSVVYHQLT